MTITFTDGEIAFLLTAMKSMTLNGTVEQLMPNISLIVSIREKLANKEPTAEKPQ